MRCFPFSTNLYRDLQQRGHDAAGLWNRRERYGRDQGWPHSAEALEDHLLWLISVGVLRREVDGQGLTSRFRLTPLGRQLLDRNPQLLDAPAPLIDSMQNALRRFWLH